MDSELHTSQETVENSERSNFLIHSPLHQETGIDKLNHNVTIVSLDKFEKILDSNGKILVSRQQIDGKTAWQRFQGFVFTFIHCFTFASSTLIAKILEQYHPFNLTIYRFQGILLPSLIVLIWSHIQEKQKPEDEKRPILASIWPPNENGNWKTLLILVVRGFIGGLAMMLLIFSLRYIQVGDTLVIQATSPIFTNLLAYFVLNEPFGIFSVFLAILSILGVGIISRPPLLTGTTEFDSGILIGCLYSVVSMLLSVFSVIMIRYLKKVHFAFLSFGLGFGGTGLSLALALIFGVFELPANLNDTLLAILLAALVFLSQITITFALKKEEAGPVMIFRTLHCVFGFILQKIFLDTPTDIFSFLGACLVLIGVVSIVGRKQLSLLPKESRIRRIFWFVLI